MKFLVRLFICNDYLSGAREYLNVVISLFQLFKSIESWFRFDDTKTKNRNDCCISYVRDLKLSHLRLSLTLLARNVTKNGSLFLSSANSDKSEGVESSTGAFSSCHFFSGEASGFHLETVMD